MHARPLHEIAADVRADWVNVSGMAEPFLAALETLDNIHDSFGSDSAVEVVAKFLDAARTWKGPTAQMIKIELNTILDSR